MKKAKLILFSLLLCFGMVFISACNGEEPPVLAENIYLTETSVELTLGDFATIGVSITPDNVSSKDFEVNALTQDVVTIDCDKENMQFTINAPNTIQNGFDTVVLEVKTLDGSNLNEHLTVTLKERVTPIGTPTDLHYNGQALEWSPVLGAKGYKLNINGTDLPMVYTNTYTLDSSFVGQDIVARVYAVAEDDSISSGFAEYTFKILSAPTKLAYLDGEISWDAVDGATGYYLYFDGKVSFTEYTKNSVSDRFSEPKTYQIKVMAVGDDQKNIESSEYCDLIEVTKLDIPKNIRIANGIVMWDMVQNVSSYKIYLDNEEPFNTGFTQLVLPQNLSAGMHTFKIASCGDEVNYISSVTSPELSFEKLAKVTSLYIENGSVCWSPNSAATSYMLYVDNVPYQTTNINVTSVDFADYSSGTYTLNVRAIGNGGNILDGDLMAQTFEATKLATPNNLHIQTIEGSNYVVWDSVNNASDYAVIINNNEPIVIKDTKYVLNVTAGTYNIKVRALGDSLSYINSNYSNMFTTTKLQTVTGLTVNNGQIVWKAVNGAGEYIVLINNDISVETANNKFDLQSTQKQVFDAGVYTISVKALASTASNINSEYCDNISVTKLATPKIAVRYGKLVNATVENSSRIEYQIDFATLAGQVVNSETKTSLEGFGSQSYQQFNITAKAYASTPEQGAVMYINSDSSEVFSCIQLPQVQATDMSMVDGIAYFAQNTYQEILEGFTFELKVIDNLSADVLTNTKTYTLQSTQREYDFTTLNASEYSYNLTAIPTYNENGESLQKIPYLTSATSANFDFTVLGAPENTKISSIADKFSTINELIAKMNSITSNSSGILVWDKVENATKYSVKIDGVVKLVTASTSCDLIGLLADDGEEHKITVQSIGNGTNIITSVASQEVSCVKLNRATDLTCDGSSISWTSEYNQNLSSTSLLSSTANIVIYVAVINNKEYVTLNTKDLSIDNIADKLSSKTYKLPKLKAGDYVTQIYAIPLNAYLTIDLFTMSGQIIETEGTKYVVSELNSEEIYLSSLVAPQGVEMNLDEDKQILSWTPLLYENGEVAEYVVSQIVADEETEFSVGSSYRQWEFKDYSPNTYQFAVYAKANKGSYFEKNGKKYYYIDSNYSQYIQTIVMQNPEVYVKNGEVVWNEITGVEKYILTFGKANGQQETREFDPKITSFVLGEEYTAGNYTFKILAQGDGSDYITSKYCDVKTFTKLDSIKNIRLENGVLKYDANTSVADQTNDCFYQLDVNGKKVSNSKYVATELEGYASAYYTIYVYAFGDNNKYLTSNVSSVIGCTKLAYPSDIYLNAGVLTWTKSNNASSYQLNVSGSYINDITGLTYDKFDELSAGDYYINVKAIGNSTSYINSDWTATKTMTKLAEIEGLRVENGIITWNKVSGNYKDIRLKIKLSNASNYAEVKIDGTATSYVLDESYVAGTYDVYMYNAGGEFAISSSDTNILKVTKLGTPTNIKITTDQYLEFDGVTNASKYVLQIKYVDSGNAVSFDITNTKIAAESLSNGGISIDKSGTYIINIMAKGTITTTDSTSLYLNSNYSADFTITKPEAPVLVDVKTTDNTSSGMITWQPVAYADRYKYKITGDNGVSIEGTTTDTFVYVTKGGNYTIEVIACKDLAGFDSEASSIQISYGLFAGSGTQDDPYLITTAENFNNIKYNLTAYYKLTQSIDFSDKTLVQISSQNNPFIGKLDGNNHSINGIKITSYSEYTGLIPFVGEGGIVTNLTVNINITTGQTVGGIAGINFGGIAGINYGTIENCVVEGTISPNYNVPSSRINAGGIAGINYGTISKCINKATIYPQNNTNITYAGGIVATNNGVVTGCGNNSSVTATYAGGIVAYSTGNISYSYNNYNAVVTATTFSNGITCHAYAGGIVGFASNSSTMAISVCYNVGTVTATSQNNTLYPYAGGIVGYNNGASLSNCYSVSVDGSGSVIISVTTYNFGRGYAGILVGYNAKGAISANNVAIYVNTNQVDYYYTNTDSTKIPNRFVYTEIDEITILNILSGYEESNNNYPTIKNNAKY